MLSGIGGGALEVAGFELVYVTAPGDGVRVGLADAWALRLESVPPVRRFASYRGQRHLSGRWWSATDGRHVGIPVVVRLTGALIDAADDGPRGWKSTHPTNPTRSPTPSNARDSLGW